MVEESFDKLDGSLTDSYGPLVDCTAQAAQEEDADDRAQSQNDFRGHRAPQYDDSDTALYTRLVRLFRSRSHRTCEELLKEVLVAHQRSLENRVCQGVDMNAFVRSNFIAFAVLESRVWTDVPVLVTVFDTTVLCVAYSDDLISLRNILLLPDVTRQQCLDGDHVLDVLRAQSRDVLPCVARLVVRDHLAEGATLEDCEKQSRLLGTLQDARTAASCCKSTSSGHTNSTLESPGSVAGSHGPRLEQQTELSITEDRQRLDLRANYLTMGHDINVAHEHALIFVGLAMKSF